MKDLDKKTQADVLLSALDERYRAMHTIRERVQSIGVWALGILLAAAGWLIQDDVTLTLVEKIFYILGVLISVGVLKFKYLQDLEKGFKSQQQVSARLEKALGFFTPGTFDEEAEGIYPKKWESAGTGSGGGRFFTNSYLLLYIGAAFLLLAILLNDAHAIGRCDYTRFYTLFIR